MNKIILADDHAVFRAGTARILAMEQDMAITAQCENLERVHSCVEKLEEVILVLSTSIGSDTEGLLLECEQKKIPVILLLENEETMPTNLAENVKGVLYRNVTTFDLVDCVRTVGIGEQFISKAPALDRRSFDAIGSRLRDRLTARELQIVNLVVLGRKNREIGLTLGISEQVVKNYLRILYDKAGVSDRLELAIYVLKHTVLAEAAENAIRLASPRVEDHDSKSA